MILEAVVLPVKLGQTAEFERAFDDAQSIIASIDGYISHELHRGIETPNHYLLLVQWETLEAHTVGFRGSAQYEQWSAALHHFYDPFPTVEHYEPVG
ncbi:MAG TPA: antibiotic biosynthesis monooxygenase [Dehalococcoidia bacterium]|nr:antibiotic biosynthesis monooxygenase [Dehalococcoidia bacterium]